MFLRKRSEEAIGWQFRTDHLKADIGTNTARGSLITFAWHGLKLIVGIARGGCFAMRPVYDIDQI